MNTMNLTEALAIVKAAGYRVSKPRAKKSTGKLVDNGDGTFTRLNAIGKPYGANYDPNYRMRYRTPPLKNDHHSVGDGISPEKWTLMCKLAQAEWDKTHKTVDDGIPEFLRRDSNNKVAA